MSSGFITEAEAEEARLKRQAEWDKVRNPEHDPITCPEPSDTRSLYVRLKEQQDKKQAEFEETHKLKNMIKGLDDDEVEFLELVDRSKLEIEKKQKQEEQQALEEFRQKSSTLQRPDIKEVLSAELISKPKPQTGQNSSRPSQRSILAAVVKKRTSSESLNPPSAVVAEESEAKKAKLDVGGMKCVAILPGIGRYDDSDSDESSSSDPEEYRHPNRDWIGRKIQQEEAESSK